jgi:2-desacetyl-2-hydroxyethyl bacteriochlorophyllide A dehydrogenase
MRAAIIEAPGRATVGTVDDPTPGPTDLIVRVGGCGICGTDLHLFDGGLPGTPYPLIAGHEFYGEVVAVGADVSSIAVGDHVAVDPNLPCHRCAQCRVGRTNLCTNYRALGVTMTGAFAELVAAPETTAYVLPPDFPLPLASLVEPLSCVIHGVDRLPRRPGDRYLVYGAGTIGLLLASVVGDYATDEVCVVDTNRERRDQATRLGFRVAASADDFDRGAGWDTVIDATGVPAAITDALGRVAAGGTLQLFGVASPEATVAISPYDVYRREISIVGSMAVLNSFDRAIPALAARTDLASALVSHELGLDDYATAIETFRAGKSMKIVIRP